mmetsp:Transcript_24465/g.52056  ORF Transcript_24465/g.52056 Transcript_24465/m.52056 type:complete len:221 (+) Transcript_24465:1207-1869(+)
MDGTAQRVSLDGGSVQQPRFGQLPGTGREQSLRTVSIRAGKAQWVGLSRGHPNPFDGNHPHRAFFDAKAARTSSLRQPDDGQHPHGSGSCHSPGVPSARIQFLLGVAGDRTRRGFQADRFQHWFQRLLLYDSYRARETDKAQIPSRKQQRPLGTPPHGVWAHRRPGSPGNDEQPVVWKHSVLLRVVVESEGLPHHRIGCRRLFADRAGSLVQSGTLGYCR